MKGTVGFALVVIALMLIPALAAAEAENAAPTVSITWPQEGLTIATETVGVTVAYEAADEEPVAQVSLIVDGTILEAQEIAPPQASGMASFTWVARGCAEGAHELTVRAVNSRGEVGEQTISVTIARRLESLDRGIRIISPKPGSRVAGRTQVAVQSDEPASISYVIFLVDDVFRAMTNVPPFAYSWNTTRYLNGIHELQVRAYLKGGSEVLSPLVEVKVDNPSGATTMRAPGTGAEAAARVAVEQRPVRAGEPTVPPPMHTASPTPVRPTITVADPELGLPGTAPFVTATGELIRPPSPARAVESGRSEPVEIAALPIEAAAPGPVGAAAPADATSSPAVGELSPLNAASAQEAEARAPETAPIELAFLPVQPPTVEVMGGAPVSVPVSTPAGAGGPAISYVEEITAGVRGPEAAPIDVALLPVPAETPAAPPLSTPAEADAPAISYVEDATGEARGPEAASIEVALLPAPVEAPAAPPTRSGAVWRGEPVAVTSALGEAASEPAASGERIAMLPPRPVERIPAPKVTAAPAPADIAYVVQAGDCLWGIAAECGVSPGELARANGIAEGDVIHPGRRLIVPAMPVYFDSRPLVTEVATTISNGRAIVEFRPVVVEAGGTVVWEAREKRATALAAGHEIAVMIGSDSALVDGTGVAMGSPAALRSDRTMVPVRFLGDVLDLVVQYQDGVIHIASGR